ncbi:hypothetical protein PIROE2DRAFT_18423 [Piromyces sp. E2]|nr:hypothetical protein PIROE2DRAFT_18423 [Piromyces sp. E2]|eukprot:OUM56815.1 hypothetical protein PIROE2DRAFT_18423 [Piromyces sp. E2]
MSNLNEINLKIKNELLYKLNIIQPEPKPKPERNTTTHSNKASISNEKGGSRPTTKTSSTTSLPSTPVKPLIPIPKGTTVSRTKSLTTSTTSTTTPSVAAKPTITSSNSITIPTNPILPQSTSTTTTPSILHAIATTLATTTPSMLHAIATTGHTTSHTISPPKALPTIKKEMGSTPSTLSALPTPPEEEEDGTFVASRALPMADVLKSIRGPAAMNSITEQYYRLKRKFEYQEILKTQQQQQQLHHSHHHSHTTK